jgi:hypothetical protein
MQDASGVKDCICNKANILMAAVTAKPPYGKGVRAEELAHAGDLHTYTEHRPAFMLHGRALTSKV